LLFPTLVYSNISLLNELSLGPLYGKKLMGIKSDKVSCNYTYLYTQEALKQAVGKAYLQAIGEDEDINSDFGIGEVASHLIALKRYANCLQHTRCSRVCGYLQSEIAI
jgi:hypothetical protein